jgi:hypothetical protein
MTFLFPSSLWPFLYYSSLANFDVLYVQVYWRVECYILQGPKAIEGRFGRGPERSGAAKSGPKRIRGNGNRGEEVRRAR